MESLKKVYLLKRDSPSDRFCTFFSDSVFRVPTKIVNQTCVCVCVCV